jgi:cellulose biosynthesis protein BcsQ
MSACYAVGGEGKEENVNKVRVNVACSDPQLGAAIVRGMSSVSRRMEFWQAGHARCGRQDERSREMSCGAAENGIRDDLNFHCDETEKSCTELWVTDNRKVWQRHRKHCLYIPEIIKQMNVQIDVQNRSNPAPVGLLRAQSPESNDGILLNRKAILDGLNSLWYAETGMPAEYLSLHMFTSLAFCSACGGSGVTACALSCARLLFRQYGKKCLYLNMTAVDDSGNYLRKKGSGNLLRILYGFRQGKHVPVRPFLCEEDGVWFFSGLLQGLDEKIGESDMEVLFRELRMQEQFDYVLIDFGSSLTSAHLKMMQCCDAVLVTGKGPLSERPAFQRMWENRLLERFPHAAMLQNMDDGEDEIFRKWTSGEEEKVDPEQKKECSSTEKSTGAAVTGKSDVREFRISRCSEAFVRMGGRWTIDLNGCFGIEMSAVAKWLEEKG